MTRTPTWRQADAPLSAEEWLARLLSPDSGSNDEEVFERWRLADPKHAAAYAEAERIHRNSALLSGDPLLRAASRAALRDAAIGNRSRRRQVWMLTAGIAACLLLTVGLIWHNNDGAVIERHYVNTMRLPQTLQLIDGTQLSLDAKSSLTIRLSPHLREVTLEQGRAEFTVAHDPQRPFLVRAGGSTIRDIGTIFQVSNGSNGVTVGLLEGRVAITGGAKDHRWTSELEPAEQMHIDNGGVAGAVAPLDLAAAQGWTHGELAFQQRRLGDLLLEMNRYSNTQLRLGDPSLAGLKVSGSFHAGDQQALAAALASGWRLRVARTAPDELTLLPPDPVR
jgi:transmembrane sensor